jgi:hypothetical protein
MDANQLVPLAAALITLVLLGLAGAGFGVDSRDTRPPGAAW